MGKEDSAIKQWLSKEERFADLFNGIVFDGELIVKPENLVKLDGESNIILQNKKNRKRGVAVKRFRDIVMRWNGKINLAVLACEAQSYVDYMMPVRNMIYDGLTYNEQKNAIWRELSKSDKKLLTSDEKLSNFRKDEKLIPTITLVFYYNEKEWDGAQELHEMLEWGDEKEKNMLKKYIPNYHINLINLSKIQDFSNFKSDLHIIFNMLKYKEDKNKLLEYTMRNEEYFRNIDNDSIRALGELLNAKDIFETIIDNNKEGQDMCKAIYDLINDSKEEGRQEGRQEGRREGKREGRQAERVNSITIFINASKRMGCSVDAIKEALSLDYGLSEVEIAKVMD